MLVGKRLVVTDARYCARGRGRVREPVRRVGAMLVLLSVAGCVSQSSEEVVGPLCTRFMIRHGWCHEDREALDLRLRIHGTLEQLLRFQLARLKNGELPFDLEECRSLLNAEGYGIELLLLDWAQDSDRMSMVYRLGKRILVEVAYLDEVEPLIGARREGVGR